jgi:peptidyl-dipeptidase Dcp
LLLQNKSTEAGHATVFNRFTQPNNPILQSLTNRATRENIQISWTRAQKNDDGDTREVLKNGKIAFAK